MGIFVKNKKYSFEDIAEICDKNNLTTVDCLKDENMVSVEEFKNGELGGECLFEFYQIKNDVFKLTWQEDKEYMPEKYR